MSRSVKSRKSLGAPSVRSIRTTAPPRLSSGMSTVSRDRRSQLSLIKRSVPSAYNAKSISPQEKAVRILENLGKRITKLNLTSEQQFNFCTKLKQLQDLINNPKESGFWNDWMNLKDSVTAAITNQSSLPPDFSNLKDFCDATFEQFSIGLGDVSEKLPSRFEASKKATEIQQKFTELSESFNKIKDKYNALDDSSTVLQFGSLISTIQSFRQILLNEYKMIFSSLRNPEVKKRINETQRYVLLPVKQQNQIARNLASYLENVEFRLSEYINPSSAVPSVKDLLQATEANLRRCITDFPEEKRKHSYKDQSQLEEKQKTYYQLEAKLFDLKRQKDQLSNNVAILSNSEAAIKDEIAKEKDGWLAEKKEFAKTLNNPDYQTLIQSTSDNLEKLRKQNAKMQDEINSRDPIIDIENVRDEAQAAIKHLDETENKLLDLRSKNFTFIELLNEDQTEFKDNVPKFLEKWELKIELDSYSELNFQLKRMNEKRSEIQPDDEKAPSKKNFSDKISKNQNDYENIRVQLQNIENLQKKIFRRKMKKLVNYSSSEEYQKIASKLSQIEEDKEEDTSKFGQLKSQAELLQTEFRLSVLRNSQQNGKETKEQQINEQKELNQKIIRNGNQIRLHLLEIQAMNSAMNYSIKMKNNINKLKDEKLNKKKEALKYEQELLKQENETHEIEQMLGIKRDDDAVVEVIFTNILEKVKKLEENIDGDLDAKINELRQKIKIKNREIRRKSQDFKEIVSEDGSQA